MTQRAHTRLEAWAGREMKPSDVGAEYISPHSAASISGFLVVFPSLLKRCPSQFSPPVGSLR